MKQSRLAFRHLHSSHTPRLPFTSLFLFSIPFPSLLPFPSPRSSHPSPSPPSSSFLLSPPSLPTPLLSLPPSPFPSPSSQPRSFGRVKGKGLHSLPPKWTPERRGVSLGLNINANMTVVCLITRSSCLPVCLSESFIFPLFFPLKSSFLSVLHFLQ